MSQAGIVSTQTSPPPPSVATSYVTDNGTAVPALNILIVHGVDSTENNDNGIIAKGGVVGTGTSNEVDVVLTNRLQGTGTTVGATTATVISLDLGATPASYMFQLLVTGFDTLTPTATSYWFMSGARTTGAAATSVGSSEDFVEDAALGMSDVDMTTSGNIVNFVVTGVAGKTLNWSAVGTYVKAV